MPDGILFPLYSTVKHYNSDAHVSRWEKEQGCDNADKPSDVITDVVMLAAAGGC